MSDLLQCQIYCNIRNLQDQNHYSHSSDYHLWTTSAFTTFKVYKIDKLILSIEKELKYDAKFDNADESYFKYQKSWNGRNTLPIEVLLKCFSKVDKGVYARELHEMQQYISRKRRLDINILIIFMLI